MCCMPSVDSIIDYGGCERRKERPAETRRSKKCWSEKLTLLCNPIASVMCCVSLVGLSCRVIHNPLRLQHLPAPFRNRLDGFWKLCEATHTGKEAWHSQDVAMQENRQMLYTSAPANFRCDLQRALAGLESGRVPSKSAKRA